MGERYVTDGYHPNMAAALTVMKITSTTAIRPKMYELIFGCSETPADQAFNLQINRTTGTAETADAVTPQPLDLDGPAAVATGQENFTVEPTKTGAAVLMSFSINQQATFRWVVPPEEGIMLPATANAGIALICILASGGTPRAEATMYHEE